MFWNRAFDTTWRRTSAVSSAVARDPTTCLAVTSLGRSTRLGCQCQGLPSPQFRCKDLYRTLPCCLLRLCCHPSWLEMIDMNSRLMCRVCGGDRNMDYVSHIPYTTLSKHVTVNQLNLVALFHPLRRVRICHGHGVYDLHVPKAI